MPRRYREMYNRPLAALWCSNDELCLIWKPATMTFIVCRRKKNRSRHFMQYAILHARPACGSSCMHNWLKRCDVGELKVGRVRLNYPWRGELKNKQINKRWFIPGWAKYNLQYLNLHLEKVRTLFKPYSRGGVLPNDKNVHVARVFITSLGGVSKVLSLTLIHLEFQL